MTHRFSILLMAFYLAAFSSVNAQKEEEKNIFENLRMTNAEIRQTSGTLVLQLINAETAGVAPDGESIVAQQVALQIRNNTTGDMIELDAPFSRYYYTGGAPGDSESTGEPSTEELLAWKAAIDASSDEYGPSIPDALSGDMLLLDPVSGEPLEVSLGREGILTCANLFWSRRHQCFVSIGSFEQEKREADGVFRIRGEMFVASPDFRNWNYPVLSKDGEFRMVWESNEVLP